MTWQRVATVVSESEPARSYEIKRNEAGQLGCSCLAFRFKRGEKTCKHLRAYQVSVAHDPFCLTDNRTGVVPIGQDWLRVKRPPAEQPAKQKVAVNGEQFTVRGICFGPIKP